MIEVLDDPADVAARGAAVLERLLPPEAHDDRFDDPAPRAAVWDTADAVGIVTAETDGSILRLDLLADGPAEATQRAVEQVIEGQDADTLELWARPTSLVAEQVAAGLGFEAHRALHRMAGRWEERPADELATRAFRPGEDEEALRRVNNAAFAAHPDQGGWSPEQLRSKLAEPWIDPDGIRLFEEDGVVQGFCWTRIHDRHEPARGEIYVIGLHPDVQGRRLGGPMTAAGLAWMWDRGLRDLFLYVEADNTRAIAAYEALGFGVWLTDRAWRRPVAGFPARPS